MRNRISRRGALGAVAASLALGAAVALGGCAPSKPEPVPSDDAVKAVVTVHVFDNAYEPAEVEIAPGQAVRWLFEGPAEHDVVSDDRSFVSELMREGSYTHLFVDEGEYAYLCSIHPEMKGVVHVKKP